MRGTDESEAPLEGGEESVRDSLFALSGVYVSRPDGSLQYVSHLGDWFTFTLLLWVAMLRRRFDQAEQLVIISDGAEWIRSLGNWLPIPTLLILDLFHVKHRIWEVAHSVYANIHPRPGSGRKCRPTALSRGIRRKSFTLFDSSKRSGTRRRS